MRQLIGKAFIAVEQIDNATIGETIKFDDVAHNDVVTVGINTQIACHSHAIVHHVVKHAVTGSSTGQTVYHMIGLVVQPLTLIDFLISGFRPGMKANEAAISPLPRSTHR